MAPAVRGNQSDMFHFCNYFILQLNSYVGGFALSGLQGQAVVIGVIPFPPGICLRFYWGNGWAFPLLVDLLRLLPARALALCMGGQNESTSTATSHCLPLFLLVASKRTITTLASWVHVERIAKSGKLTWPIATFVQHPVTLLSLRTSFQCFNCLVFRRNYLLG